MSPPRTTVGHPVDVGSGVVFTANDDFRLPGTTWLVWRRSYASDSTVDSWLGRRWTTSFFMSLARSESGYTLTNEEGAAVVFDTEGGAPLAIGQTSVNLPASMELSRAPDHFAVLHWHEGGAGVERFVFLAPDAAPSRLQYLESLAGHRVSVHYDAPGRPSRIVQELEQRTIEITYDAVGLMTQIHLVPSEGPRILLVSYEYDDQRRLITATDAMNNTTAYVYDAQHRLVRETNPLGSTFQFAYDASGRCVYTAGDGRFMERKLDYSRAPRRTRVTDSLGNVSHYYLNSLGQVIQQVSPRGAVLTHQYDQHGRLVRTTNSTGQAQEFVFDERGDRVALVDEAGGAIRLEFNELHLPTAIIDEAGARSVFEYDEQGRLIGQVNPLGNRWSLVRDGRGLVVEARTPGGRVIRHIYDQALRWWESHDQFGLIQRVETDAFGDATVISDSAGVRYRIGYDALGRAIEVRVADKEPVRMRWNALAELLERTEGGGRETWEYDAFGYLIRQTNSLGATMTIAYDTEGKPTQVVNRVGERLETRYDADGNPVQELRFDGRVQTFEFDLLGNCTRIVKSGGESIAQEFDALGRLIGREASDGGSSRFTYDPRGYLLQAVNAAGAVEFEYDVAGRVTAEVQRGRRIEYRYDAGNNRTGRTLAGGRGGALAFRFDARGRPIACADEAGVSQEWDWDGLDRLVARRFDSGAQELLTYGPDRLLQEQRIVSRARSTVVRRLYAYDQQENVLARDDLRQGRYGYEYDAVNRLTTVSRDGRPTERYAYDANGSIVGTHAGPRELARGGRTVATPRRRYEYDQDGRVERIREAGRTTELGYDADDQLISLRTDAGLVVRYSYDALGRRVSRSVGDDTTEFLWEGSLPAAELRGGETSDVYLFLDRQPMLHWRGAARYTPVVDRSGAVQEVFNGDGQISWRCALEAYGNLLASDGAPASPFRFPGQYGDRESGFHYNFYRYYDPDLGDYLTPDPIGIEGGVHFYAYPRNPFIWDDPFGLTCSNKHKGKMGERRMDKYYKDKGFEPIHSAGRPRGIDGVYKNKNPNGKPQYIIVESKYGSSTRKRTVDGNMQNSDGWINSPIAGSGPARLDAAAPAHAGNIEAAARANPANVERHEYRAPAGKPGSHSVLGVYDPDSMSPD